MIYFIFAVILFLYLRTWNYKYLIDDHVPRSGMYVTIPPPPVPFDKDGVRFDDKKRSWLCSFTNIGTFLLTCWVIYLLWGWEVSLLYAVIPSNVSGVAWGRTGNYYMTTVFLVLTAYYFLLIPNGWILSYFLFFGALHSTISALPFVVLACFYPMGWTLIVPAIIFLTGKRFTTGLIKRKKGHEEQGIMSAKIHIRNVTLVFECMAYYILLSTGFMPMGFFHMFGQRGNLYKFNLYFLASLSLVLLFVWFGLIYNPFGILWFVLFIGVFCQAIPNLGQFIAERYMYIANVGFCMILASYLPQEAYWFLVGLWLMIAYHYIPAWRSNEALFAHGISSFPDCPDNYVNLGSLYLDKGEWQKAVPPLLAGVTRVKGRRYKILMNLAKCYANCGYFTQALRHSREALHDCSPDQVDGINRFIRRLEDRIKKIQVNEKMLKKKGII